MADEKAPPPPFETYARMVQQIRHVATVTAENIGQIAALIAAQVDYSSGEPVLLVPSRGPGGQWKVRVGGQLTWFGGEPPMVSNASGPPHGSDWKKVRADG